MGEPEPPYRRAYDSLEGLIKQGILHNLSEWGVRAGFPVPAMVTKTIWEELILWTAEDHSEDPQSQDQRAYDVLNFAAVALLTSQGNEADFPMVFQARRGFGLAVIRLKAKIVILPQGTAIVVVMAPGEDIGSAPPLN